MVENEGHPSVPEAAVPAHRDRDAAPEERQPAGPGAGRATGRVAHEQGVVRYWGALPVPD